jgi:hypothetical protein
MARAKREEPDRPDLFRRLACSASDMFGTHWAFIAALSVVIGWAVCGPSFDSSESWQLVINTTTASEARDVFADLEDASDQEIAAFQREFRELRKRGVKGSAAVIEAHKNVREDQPSKNGDDAR